jgi:hypothetical protein
LEAKNVLILVLELHMRDVFDGDMRQRTSRHHSNVKDSFWHCSTYHRIVYILIKASKSKVEEVEVVECGVSYAKAFSSMTSFALCF